MSDHWIDEINESVIWKFIIASGIWSDGGVMIQCIMHTIACVIFHFSWWERIYHCGYTVDAYRMDMKESKRF